MSRKGDLEQLIRNNYKIITKYESIMGFSERPEEQHRANHMINEQLGRIKEHLDKYIPLCINLRYSVPEDIVEIIIAHFPNVSIKDLSVNSQISQKNSFRTSEKIRILFLAANPRNTDPLRIDQEMREIEHTLRQASFREQFEIRQHWAVQVHELQGFLLRYRPNIIHFSGHGTVNNGIVLEEMSEKVHPISDQALARLFSILKDNIQCVVLNACYSERQAQAIAEHIDCVIGMSEALEDLSAINFSKAFYQALGYGRDVKTAFELGCLQINLVQIGEESIPRLVAKKRNPESIILAGN